MAQKSKILGAGAVATAGVRVQITSSNLACSGVIFQASTGNTGKLYVGDSTVTSSNGISLSPGETYTIASQSLDGVMDAELILSDFWIDADTNGNSVKIHYLTVRS